MRTDTSSWDWTQAIGLHTLKNNSFLFHSDPWAIVVCKNCLNFVIPFAFTSFSDPISFSCCLSAFILLESFLQTCFNRKMFWGINTHMPQVPNAKCIVGTLCLFMTRKFSIHPQVSKRKMTNVTINKMAFILYGRLARLTSDILKRRRECRKTLLISIRRATRQNGMYFLFNKEIRNAEIT